MNDERWQADSFISVSRTYLLGEYLPKIRKCLLELDEDDLWWRPNDASNSVANLILHLAGNARQWILGGVGGEDDTRRRAEEFDRHGGYASGDLNRLLTGTLADVDRRLSALSGDGLAGRRRIQGRDVSVLEAVYHVVEHFAMHTGQIIYITKMRTGRDLRFYEASDTTFERRW